MSLPPSGPMLSMMGTDLGNRYAYGAAPGSAATGAQVAGTVIRQHAAERGRLGVQGGPQRKSWRWASALVIPSGMP
jgi:hypothetical protein